MKLMAIKSMQYRTRRLKAGDEFDAPTAHGRLFVAIKKATEVREPGAISAPTAAVAKKMQAIAGGDDAKSADQSDEIKALRAEYLSVVGKKPFGGWDAATLREKIDAAKA